MFRTQDDQAINTLDSRGRLYRAKDNEGSSMMSARDLTCCIPSSLHTKS